MDFSVIAYILLPALILTGIFLIHPMKWIIKTEYYYMFFILSIFCLILPANILLYHYWGSLINFRALSYIKDFSEISSSFTILQLIVLLALLTIFIFTVLYCFKKYAFHFLQPVVETPIKKTIHWLLMVFISIIMLRGGLQMLPMNESLVSISDNNFVNQTAVNPAWHLANDIYRAGLFSGNPFETTPQEAAEEKVKNLFSCDADSFPRILMNKRPNIVIIILEGFTADIVSSMGGEKGITPTLDQLISEGVPFQGWGAQYLYTKLADMRIEMLGAEGVAAKRRERSTLSSAGRWAGGGGCHCCCHESMHPLVKKAQTISLAAEGFSVAGDPWLPERCELPACDPRVEMASGKPASQ